MTDFAQLFKNFHQSEWSIQEIEVEHTISTFDWSRIDNSCFLVIGNIKGYLQTISLDQLTGKATRHNSMQLATTKISHVRLNQLATLSVSALTDSKFVLLVQHDPQTGEIVKEKKPVKIKTDTPTLCASFMEDITSRRNLLILGERSSISLIDIETGMQFKKFYHPGGALSMRSWNGCMITCTTIHGSLAVWDARHSEPVALLGPKKQCSKQCIYAVDSSEKFVTLADFDGNIQIFELGNTKKGQIQKIQDTAIRSLSFSSKYRFLISSDETRLYIHNMTDKLVVPHGRLPFREIANVRTVVETRWHPSQCLFVARSTDLVLRFFKPLFAETK